MARDCLHQAINTVRFLFFTIHKKVGETGASVCTLFHLVLVILS